MSTGNNIVSHHADPPMVVDVHASTMMTRESLLLMTNIDFRAVIIFVTMVEQGGIEPTARILGLSSPTVSMGLSRFRNACSISLFTRERRRLEPTPEALQLARELRPCLLQIGQVIARVWQSPEPDVRPDLQEKRG